MDMIQRMYDAIYLAIELIGDDNPEAVEALEALERLVDGIRRTFFPSA